MSVWYDIFCLMRLALRAYRIARETGGTGYAGITNSGVPSLCIFVGVGRNAWRVTQHAIETFQVTEQK